MSIFLRYVESLFSLYLNIFFGHVHFIVFCFLVTCEQWGCRQPADSHPLSNRWYRIYTEDGWRSRHRTRSLIIVLSYGDEIMLNIFVDSVAILAWCEFLQPFRLVFHEHRILRLEPGGFVNCLSIRLVTSGSSEFIEHGNNIYIYSVFSWFI
jgi:hypothetical protein